MGSKGALMRQETARTDESGSPLTAAEKDRYSYPAQCTDVTLEIIRFDLRPGNSHLTNSILVQIPRYSSSIVSYESAVN